MDKALSPPSNLKIWVQAVRLQLYCYAWTLHLSWTDRWCESTTCFVYGQPLVKPIQELSLQITVMMQHDTTYFFDLTLPGASRLYLERERCNVIWICNQKRVRGDKRVERRNIITNAEKGHFSAGSDKKWDWVLMSQAAFSLYIAVMGEERTELGEMDSNLRRLKHELVRFSWSFLQLSSSTFTAQVCYYKKQDVGR